MGKPSIQNIVLLSVKPFLGILRFDMNREACDFLSKAAAYKFVREFPCFRSKPWFGALDATSDDF